MHAWYIHCVLFWISTFILSLYIMLNPHPSTSCNWWLFKDWASTFMKNISMFGAIQIAYNIIFTFSIITWCIIISGLSTELFSHPNYLVVQHWVHTAVLFPDSVTPGGPQVFYFVKFFTEKWVIYMRDTPLPHHCHPRCCIFFCYHYLSFSLNC